MRGGTLSEWLVFEQRISESNPAGGTIESWVPDFEDWGEVQRLSELASRFIIRYRTFTEDGTEIAPNTHRILWHGRRWTITAAIADRRHSQYTIDCDGGDLLEATHLESADREFIDGLVAMRPPLPPAILAEITAELMNLELGAAQLAAVEEAILAILTSADIQHLAHNRDWVRRIVELARRLAQQIDHIERG
jgi:hypothetical protein